MKTKIDLNQKFYIHPGDADTNKAIANLLQERAVVSASEGKRCTDGETRDVWELNLDAFEQILMSRASLLLRCRLFLSNDDGVLQEFQLDVSSKEYQAPDLREIIEGRLNEKIAEVSGKLQSAVGRPRLPKRDPATRKSLSPRPPRKIKPVKTHKP